MRKIVLCAWVSVTLVLSSSLIGCQNQGVQVSNIKAAETIESTEVNDFEEVSVDLYYKASAEKKLDNLETQLKLDFAAEDVDLFYYYNFVDLNNDQSNETLVWLREEADGKKQGGKLVIYDTSFKILYSSNTLKPPLIVLDEMHDGWLDFAVFIEKGMYGRIKMDKGTYQMSDKSKENVIEYSTLKGCAYLSDVNSHAGFQIE